MKSAERPLTLVVTLFLTPSTRASALMRTHRATLLSSPWTSGICQCEATGTMSASGQRATISRPRSSSRAASSA